MSHRSVLLYDPGQGAWQAAPPLSVGRSQHTATRLPDGKVLVVAGLKAIYPYVALSSVEVFDPQANTWATGKPLRTARIGHTATLLKDGRVLVTGGCDCDPEYSGTLLNSVEIYNPANRQWRAGPPMNEYRAGGHTATLLPDGRVLISGGKGYIGDPAHTAEIFDPVANTWTPTTPPPLSHSGASATLLADGRVLFVARNNVDIYDPASDSWTVGRAPSVARWGHQALLLPNGRVLLVGGYSLGSVTAVEQYDPSTDRWLYTTPLKYGRADFTLLYLADGRVIAIGGNGQDETHLTAELFDPGSLFAAQSGQPGLLGRATWLYLPVLQH